MHSIVTRICLEITTLKESPHDYRTDYIALLSDVYVIWNKCKPVYKAAVSAYYTIVFVHVEISPAGQGLCFG